MVVLWGHLLGDTKIFSFRGSGFKANLWTSKLMLYDIIFVRVSFGAGINSIIIDRVNFEVGATFNRRNCDCYFELPTDVGAQKSDCER